MDRELRDDKDKFEIPDFCRSMLDLSPMPMALVDGNSHVIRYVNPVFCLLIGKTEEQLIGDSFSHALPGSGECVSMLDRVHRTGRPETYTGQEGIPAHPLFFSFVLWSVLAADRRRVGIMVQVMETTLFHVQAIEMNEAFMQSAVRQHELTEAAVALNEQLRAEILHRERAEKEMELQQLEIEASEQRYRGLIEAIPQIVWTATPNGTLDFVNSKGHEYVAVDLDTFNQAGSSWLLHPDDKDRTLEAWTHGLESGSAVEIEHRLRNSPTSGFRWHLSRAIPIAGEDGHVAKWFGTSTDVEDRKRAELAVFNQQKSESLAVLAGGLAHDFNNLLTGILSGASLVSDCLPPSNDLQSLLTDVIHAGERAAHLTRQMLAYAGKASFLIDRIDISDAVRSTCELIKGSIPSHVRLTLELPPNLPPVEGDPGQIHQVAMNLILNAAEAIDESKAGSVLVNTSLSTLSTDVIDKIGLMTGKLTPGSYVVLEVQDNGSGMDETTLTKIFDPFYTTKFTGRGLGLSAVEGILRTQKGALEVHSRPWAGSTFRVYLPTAPPRERGTEIPSGRVKIGRGTGTILVVDDEQIVRRMLKLSLENGGFSVRLAESGEEAIQILQSETEGSISLILLDSSMPGMSGRQVMERIRALAISVPVLICSGYSEEVVSREFSGLDIVGFIQKPFTSRQLANRVSAALNVVLDKAAAGRPNP
jgi:PAS domain S-box-containing protein